MQFMRGPAHGEDHQKPPAPLRRVPGQSRGRQVTLFETIVSLTSIVAGTAAICYAVYIGRHAGRNRPHDPERLRRFIENAPYEDEIRACAAQVLGSEEAAQAWMTRPAAALADHRPIDLVATPSGARAVRQYLTRLKQARDGWRASAALA